MGSDLRGDDVAGLRVAEALEKRLSRRGGVSCFAKGAPAILVFQGGTAPENFTGEIRRFEPSHLVLVDAADMGKAPGTVELLSPQETRGISFSTHQLPLQLMIKFLGETLQFETFFVGLQPKNLAFGAPVSDEVQASIGEVTDALVGVLSRRS